MTNPALPTPIPPRAALLGTLLAATLAFTGCASGRGEPGPEAAACAAVTGRYRDAGLGSPGTGGGKEVQFAAVLGLDPSTTASVADAERAIDIREQEDGSFRVAIAKITPPDTVLLWDVAARCDDGELRFETTSRYESSDGVHVTRQQLRFGLMADDGGSLIVRREQRTRSLGFLDVRPGGDPVEFYRFASHVK